MSRSFQTISAFNADQNRDIVALTPMSFLFSGLDTSNVSRRHDAARLKLQTDRKLAYAKAQVEKLYHKNIAESQT